MTKVKSTKVQQIASTRALIWLIIGLLMAVIGYMWLDFFGSRDDVNSTLGGASLVSFGLLIAGSALLILVAIILSSSSRPRRKTKRKK